jgi:crotonobetainyl-CoA:carnitine CoA-transferase CaiB-like acyl-CoA transferase
LAEPFRHLRSPHPYEDSVLEEGRPGPLAGLRVVDLTDLRGAMCSRILADFGAEVLCVGPDGPEPPGATAYLYRNANKRGVAVDLETDEGRSRLLSLLADADVLVENLSKTQRRTFGLDHESLVERFPSLVHVVIADMGLSGVRSDWYLEPLPALAASGALHAAGFPELPPCNAPGHFAHDCASVYAAAGAVIAVLDRDRHGAGQLVEISVQEAALAGITPWSIAWEDYLKVNPLLPAEGTRNADGNYWVLPASDGWVRFIVGPRHWSAFLELLRSPEELSGPEWTDIGFRLANTDVVRLLAFDRLRDRTRAELFEEALQRGVPMGVIHDVTEFIGHAQVTARRFFADSRYPGLEGLPFATPPVHLSRTPASVRGPAPADTDDTRGFSSSEAERPKAALTEGTGPLLAGLRVVEFGVAAVVPELCMMLSELGADVIKIESRTHPDVLRAGGGDQMNKSFAFNTECRGRKSVALDLTTPEGRQLALDLCASADIVAENNRGGALDRLGLGYEDVRARNADVIYVSSQGYGKGGPLGQMPAFGPLNMAFTGIHLLWNQPDAPYPCGTTLNHPDSIAGKLILTAVLGALHHRAATGEGQHLEMAQTEVVAYLLGEIYLDAARTGSPPPVIGNRSPDAAPHGVYPSAGNDRWIAIAVTSDDQWQRFRSVVGVDDDPDLREVKGRLQQQEDLDRVISEWTRVRTPEEAAEVLQEHGISAMPVMGPRDHHRDPHIGSRGFIVSLHHPEVGDERHAGNPIRMSRYQFRTAQSAPCLGADTDEVLATVLGLSAERLEALHAAGVTR